MNNFTSSALPNNFKTFTAAMAVVIALLTPFAMDGYTPSLPAVMQFFGCSENEMQLTISFFLLGSAISQLFYGPLSDRFGRRNIVLVGMSICVIGSMLCAMASTPYWLIAARFIQGAGAGAGNTLYRAILRDMYSGTRLAQMASRLSIIYTVGWAVAPVIGGYIQEIFNWRGNLIFAAVFSIIAILLVQRYLTETNLQPLREATQWRVMWKNYRFLLTNRIFIGNVLCSSLTLSGIIAYISISPFLLEDNLGLTPVEYGWSAIVLAAGLAIGNILNSTLVTRYGTLRMLLLGIILMTLSASALFLTGWINIINVYGIVIPIFCFSIAAGFVYANAMSGAFQNLPHIAGSGAAIYGFLQMLGTFVVSLFVVELRDENQQTLGLVLMALGITAILVFKFLITSFSRSQLLYQEN